MKNSLTENIEGKERPTKKVNLPFFLLTKKLLSCYKYEEKSNKCFIGINFKAFEKVCNKYICTFVNLQ